MRPPLIWSSPPKGLLNPTRKKRGSVARKTPNPDQQEHLRLSALVVAMFPYADDDWQAEAVEAIADPRQTPTLERLLKEAEPVGAAIEVPSQPSRPIRRNDIDSQSPAWRAAIHEAGHILEIILHHRGGLRHANVNADGSGRVYHQPIADRGSEIRILVAGYAADSCFYFGIDGGAEEDLDHLAALGVCVADENGVESGQLMGLRLDVEADIKRNRQFVEAVAAELYAVHPAPVSRETILSLWQQHKHHWET